MRAHSGYTPKLEGYAKHVRIFYVRRKSAKVREELIKIKGNMIKTSFDFGQFEKTKGDHPNEK